MNQLTAIYLVAEGFKNIATIDEQLQQDLRNWIGFTQNQEALKEQAGTTDTWLVLAKQNTEVDNITTERNWLYGTKTNQYALVLQFIVRGQGSVLTLTPGLFLQAELVYFPSTAPFRAIIKRQISSNAITTFESFTGWQQVAENETKLSSRQPVRAERPYIIKQLKPVQYNQQWWLQDEEQQLMQMKNEHKIIWKLLSLSGGDALDMAVIGREDLYEPVGVWYSGEYKIL